MKKKKIKIPPKKGSWKELKASLERGEEAEIDITLDEEEEEEVHKLIAMRHEKQGPFKPQKDLSQEEIDKGLEDLTTNGAYHTWEREDFVWDGSVTRGIPGAMVGSLMHFLEKACYENPSRMAPPPEEYNTLLYMHLPRDKSDPLGFTAIFVGTYGRLVVLSESTTPMYDEYFHTLMEYVFYVWEEFRQEHNLFGYTDIDETPLIYVVYPESEKSFPSLPLVVMPNEKFMIRGNPIPKEWTQPLMGEAIMPERRGDAKEVFAYKELKKAVIEYEKDFPPKCVNVVFGSY